MEQTEPREYFTYFRSYHTAIKMLPRETRLELYDALGEYMFEGKDPNLSKKARPYWELIKPTLDKSNKNRDNGSKGGRPKKTDGFSDSETTGNKTDKTIGTYESESNKDKEKDKDRDTDKGSGAKAPPRRLMKQKTAAVFESMPEKPPDGDAETQRLKQEFSQKWNRVCKEHDNATAEPSTETVIPDSSTQAQAPQTFGIQATDQTDLPEHENRAPHEPRSPPG